MPQKVIVMELNGKRLDISHVMVKATNADWLALQEQTGRGPLAFARRAKILRYAGLILAAVASRDDAAAVVEEAPADLPDEREFLEAFTDLVFLGRRIHGERDLLWQDVFDSTSLFEMATAYVLATANAAVEQVEQATDPTTAPH